jgi:hypothetical protein
MTASFYFGYCPACKPLIEEALKESLTIITTIKSSCDIIGEHQHVPIVMNKQLRCRYIRSPGSLIATVKLTNDARRQFLRFMTN